MSSASANSDYPATSSSPSAHSVKTVSWSTTVRRSTASACRRSRWPSSSTVSTLRSIVASPRPFAWTDDAWMEGRAARQSPEAAISIYEAHVGSWLRPADPRESLWDLAIERLAGDDRHRRVLLAHAERAARLAELTPDLVRTPR